MGARAPKVSVCVPTRNRSAELRRTLQAILTQGVKDIELIVGDDASTDDTEEVVRSFKDDRIRYHRHQSNLGIYPNWNSLIAMARGEYICVYHDHDFYLPTIVERSLELLERHPGVVFVHTAVLLVDRFRRPLQLLIHPLAEVVPGWEFQRLQVLRSYVTASVAMVRRVAYERAGPYNPRFGLGSDSDMWLRLSALGDVGYVRDVQALIMARSRDDPTSRFEWNDELGRRRLQEEWLDRTYEPGSAEHARQLNKLQRCWDMRMVREQIKAALYESESVRKERYPLLLSGTHGRAPRCFIRLVQGSRVARALLRWTAHPVHMASLERRRREAVRFCESCTDVAKYVGWV
jgi:glycosyltransferase involved in cell wall biosynthesis